MLANLKQSYKWLYEADNISLQSTYENYIVAMKKFFKGIAKYPKFKSKRNLIQSFKLKNVTNTIRIDNNRIRANKYGFVKFRGLKRFNG
jgi:putative transposase